MELTDCQLAYVAGLFDGEGSVSVYETIVGKRQNNPRPAFIYQAQIANTYWPVILWLLEHCGGTFARKSRGNVHHRQGFTWRVTGSPATAFMEAILPYCIIKASQIQMALVFRGMLTPRNVRQTDLMLMQRRAVVQSIKEEKHAI